MGKNRALTGYYKPKNKNKYVGDLRSIYYRSSWERSFCKWCDLNKNVKKWAIEPLKIPYIDAGTGKPRMYNPDFFVEMDNGTKYLIEVKPQYETVPPVKISNTKKYQIAENTYMTNTSKWEAAKIFCEKKNWSFKIVTEETFAVMGIKLFVPITPLKLKNAKSKKINYKKKSTKKKTRAKGKKVCQ